MEIPTKPDWSLTGLIDRRGSSVYIPGPETWKCHVLLIESPRQSAIQDVNIMELAPIAEKAAYYVQSSRCYR